MGPPDSPTQTFRGQSTLIGIGIMTLALAGFIMLVLAGDPVSLQLGLPLLGLSTALCLIGWRARLTVSRDAMSYRPALGRRREARFSEILWIERGISVDYWWVFVQGHDDRPRIIPVELARRSPSALRAALRRARPDLFRPQVREGLAPHSTETAGDGTEFRPEPDWIMAAAILAPLLVLANALRDGVVGLLWSVLAALGFLGFCLLLRRHMGRVAVLEADGLVIRRHGVVERIPYADLELVERGSNVFAGPRSAHVFWAIRRQSEKETDLLVCNELADRAARRLYRSLRNRSRAAPTNEDFEEEGDEISEEERYERETKKGSSITEPGSPATAETAAASPARQGS